MFAAIVEFYSVATREGSSSCSAGACAMPARRVVFVYMARSPARSVTNHELAEVVVIVCKPPARSAARSEMLGRPWRCFGTMKVAEGHHAPELPV